jgi:hypothetical protein
MTLAPVLCTHRGATVCEPADAFTVVDQTTGQVREMQAEGQLRSPFIGQADTPPNRLSDRLGEFDERSGDS